MGKNRILIKGCNLAVGSNRGAFLPKLLTSTLVRVSNPTCVA